MFFSRNTVGRQVGPSSQGANVFFAKYGGPSSGSLLAVGGIIICLRILWGHLLRAAMGHVRPYCQPIHVHASSELPPDPTAG